MPAPGDIAWDDAQDIAWDPPAEEAKPGLLRRIVGAIAPGVVATFTEGPEREAERQAFADMKAHAFGTPGADPNAYFDAAQRSGLLNNVFAPMGTPGALISRAGPVAKKLDKTAIEQGRKALSGIGTPLAARKPIPEAAVRQALDTGAIKPLGTVGGTAERLEGAASRLGEEYGAILAELERQGVTGPNAVDLAKKIRARAADALENSLSSSRPPTLAKAADELVEKVGGATPKAGHARHGKPPVPGLVDPFGRPAPTTPPAPAEPRLKLSQAEEIKRGLQSEARREYDKITRQYTTAGETKKELAAIVREAIEESVREQASRAPGAAASFEPVKKKLANTLEALKHAEEGAARAARRKPVSLTSTIAGSAAGAATGSPTLGVLSALGHGVADARLASTLAAGAHRGAKFLTKPRYRAPERFTALPGQAGAQMSPELEALLRALRVRLSPAGAEDDR